MELLFHMSMKERKDHWPFRCLHDDGGHDDTWEPRTVDRICNEYNSRARSFFLQKPLVNAGIAVDKASVRGLDLQNGFMVTPDGVGVILLPQVAYFY